MPTFLHGVATAQNFDKSGEVVQLSGIDTSSLSNTGCFTWEHQNNNPATLVGKILKAKKIFSEKDCSSKEELYFWNKCKVPYLYVMGELLDDYTSSAKECAGQLKYSKDNPDKAPILGFSIEGAEVPGTRVSQKIITRSIARKVTLTASPCNLLCIVEIYDTNQQSQVRDEFEEIFKSESNAKELLKSEEGLKIYEQYLAKKDSSVYNIKKSIPNNIKIGRTSSGKDVFSHSPVHSYGFGSTEHKEASSLHQKASKATSDPKLQHHHFERMKLHNSAAQTAGVKENRLKVGLAGRRESAMTTAKQMGLTKALEAGSYNAAPSTLVNGAVYQKESLPVVNKSKQKKKNWYKQADQDYENWTSRQNFEKFMKSRMPHLKDGEIRSIGRVLALKKSLEAENNVVKMLESTDFKYLFTHPKKSIK